MKGIEKHNLREIKRLNQRGGRMLSIIDLLLDGTLSLEMASYLMVRMQENPSFLTAALKSGTGKTTLMGALLNLIKPGVRIESIEEVPPNPKENTKYMVHEIGRGPYYSYLWGSDIKDLFSINEGTFVSGIHADNFKEIRKKLINEISINKKDFHKLDLILIMRKLDKRRVTNIYENKEGEFNLIYEFKRGEFIKNNSTKELKNLEEAKLFLKKLMRKKILNLEDVRKNLLKFLEE